MRRNLLLVLGAAIILGCLFVVIRPRLPDAAPEARTIAIAIRGGKMEPLALTVNEGDSVTLAISSDRALAFHLHGYDIERDLQPGATAQIAFVATLTGRFEIEDEGSNVEFGTLIVQPRGER